MTDTSKPAIPNAIDRQRLAAMAFVAKVRDDATRRGVPCVGGFISPTGEIWSTDNMADFNMTPPDLPELPCDQPELP